MSNNQTPLLSQELKFKKTLLNENDTIELILFENYPYVLVEHNGTGRAISSKSATEYSTYIPASLLLKYNIVLGARYIVSETTLFDRRAFKLEHIYNINPFFIDGDDLKCVSISNKCNQRNIQRNKNHMIRNDDSFKYSYTTQKEYTKIVRDLTKHTKATQFELIRGHERYTDVTLQGVSLALDHELPIAEGYRQNIDPRHIAHYTNLQVVSTTYNSSQCDNLKLDYETLKKRIENATN